MLREVSASEWNATALIPTVGLYSPNIGSVYPGIDDYADGDIDIANALLANYTFARYADMMYQAGDGSVPIATEDTRGWLRVDMSGVFDISRKTAANYITWLKGRYPTIGSLNAAYGSDYTGFDAIDIKSCHGYLLAELASAYNRPGEYGGSFENRFRLLKNGIRAAKVYEDDSFMVTARVGIYDGYAYPWGFGVSPESGMTPDWTEPIRLVHELHDELGLDMVNLTMGNPYATTHVTRPFDFGKYEPDEHPFVGLSRMIHGIGAVKKAVPEMTVWASAPTYLRAYADLFSAGAVEQSLCDGMLFGRMAFADPDFANEIVKNGRIDPKRVCLTCGKCGDLIRAHKPTGCVIRDSKTFMPFYKEFLEIKKTQRANFRG